MKEKKNPKVSQSDLHKTLSEQYSRWEDGSLEVPILDMTILPQQASDELSVPKGLMLSKLTPEETVKTQAWLIDADGLVTAEQAVRQIRESQGWSDNQAKQITDDIQLAMVGGEVPRYDIKTGKRHTDKTKSLIPVTTIEDVMKYLQHNYNLFNATEKKRAALEPATRVQAEPNETTKTKPSAPVVDTRFADGRLKVEDTPDRPRKMQHNSLKDWVWRARALSTNPNNATDVWGQLIYMDEVQPDGASFLGKGDTKGIYYTNQNNYEEAVYRKTALRAHLIRHPWAR